MKRYILFGLTLLMAFPVCVMAQDDDTEDEAEAAVRVVKKQQKQYPTRVIRGRVLNATTGQPVAGTIIAADDIEGYSVLTEDDGTYELKVPVFTTSVFVSMPDSNAVRVGLQKGETQHDIIL
jgi:type II secretory pathway pseudopilin PulG